MYATTDASRAKKDSSYLRRRGLLPGHHERAFVPDGWQASLFGLADPSIDRTFAGIQRIQLDETSWIDHLPFWLAGADLRFGELGAPPPAPLRGGRAPRAPGPPGVVVLGGGWVGEPRLTSWWSEGGGGREPLPVL